MRILGIAVAALAVSLIVLAVCHHIALRIEAERLAPNGRLVELNGYRVHVYTQGENPDAPALIFLSGSATVAPVYDFKQLYGLLSDEYRIAVVEKAGYGYSDIVAVSRDVETVVHEVRSALDGAGVEGPYVLLPHSMSGLEALFWAQNYPDEIAAIVGLDMAVPASYDDFDFGKAKQTLFFGGIAAKLGLLRIPGVYPLSTNGLSQEEREQQRLLMYRNAVNRDYILEALTVYENAQTVRESGVMDCPILLFSSNGREIGDFWIPTQEQFAQEHDARLIRFDCGHYLHYYKSGEMAVKIKSFLMKLEGAGSASE